MDTVYVVCYNIKRDCDKLLEKSMTSSYEYFREFTLIDLVVTTAGVGQSFIPVVFSGLTVDHADFRPLTTLQFRLYMYEGLSLKLTTGSGIMLV